MVCATSFTREIESINQLVERGLNRATYQSLYMAKVLEAQNDKLPRTYENGKLKTADFRRWVSGFFPGVLWMLYENSHSRQLRHYAEVMTARVEPAKNITTTHDLGFMLYCSFGQGYRLTGNTHYLDVIKEGTKSLLTRWNPHIGAIKSWQTNKKWQYPVIIDNMMNLEMLCFMSRQTGDITFADIANKHAQTTIKNHFREDFSTFHVVSYDTLSALPHAKNTAQGYADNSSWARGQAWGLYGYTMMYRETHNPIYLRQATQIATFLVNHPRLSQDKIPYWDYDAPDIPKAKRDASAAAIMASALIELSQLDSSSMSPVWLSTAEQQLRSLSTPEYLAEEGEQSGFILKHSVGSLPGKSEIDVPLTYADYYYVEALMRLKKLLTKPTGIEDRQFWINQLTHIAKPVLKNLSEGTLKKNMPYESLDPNRREASYLEAVGRTVCGIAPWLELGPDNTAEGKLRAQYINWTIKGIRNATNPDNADFLTFTAINGNRQPLVDAAFLAEGILRAPTQIWHRLGTKGQRQLVNAWKNSRSIKAYESNWLLFASMIEAALLEFTGECDMDRLCYGINKFRNEWYKGDSWYSDGKDFHLDYYNSLVIHPMLTEVLRIMKKHNISGTDFLTDQEHRHTRHATQLERMISPEGTYPVIGRSITYRFGSFHALADAAYLHLLSIHPAQVRCALTAVIRHQLSHPGTFDDNGWLRVGYTGNQINMSERYINTGSEYLCTVVFLPLGLPATDVFWNSPFVDWTAKKAWSNQNVSADHAL